MLIKLSICLLFALFCVMGAESDTQATDLSAIFSDQNNIWSKISQSIDLSSAYQHNRRVQKQIHWYLSHKDVLTEFTQNAQPYIYWVTQEVSDHGMPVELALLPMIESDYKPTPRSNANALGLWQLRSETARSLGVHINGWYDGRRDVIASTEAALSYLQYLHDYFHSWPLAFAAYNAGIGKVIHAIKYNKQHGRPTDFWSLPLPQQTKQYVPKLLAIAMILAHPTTYHFSLPFLNNSPYFTEVTLNFPMTLNNIAKLSHTDIKTIRKLNPGIKSEPTAHHKYNILIPINNSNFFQINLAQYINKQKSPIPPIPPKLTQKTKTTLVKPRHQPILTHLDPSVLQLGQELLNSKESA